ncbi:MerR family transcriptional regulator [[Mycobacterium] kokjensenii]|uniref:MerR family transcriptional regulator n=1 Tax=[Mycobacterium] kokjensenii TaxID=3064287 RepID=A0ABM9LXG2_9MYCO|nr:MerR family transcriptional regulator [Mycolicibacter sp. MU0083]CAJ1506344.1 MerR family transcriptional regulator [Mycolicibacter sp. MU0083]
MRISQLAQRSEVPASTLRFYESVGLLPAARTKSGYRVYGEDAVQRLSFIRAAKRVGLPLDEIRELLVVWDEGACRDVRARMRPMMAARLDDVAARITELRRFAEVLQDALDHLDALPDRPEPCNAQCSFLRSRQSQPTVAVR